MLSKPPAPMVWGARHAVNPGSREPGIEFSSAWLWAWARCHRGFFPPVNIARSWWELRMRLTCAPSQCLQHSQSLQNMDIFLVVTWNPKREFRIFTVWLQRGWCFSVPRFQDHCPFITTVGLTVVKASLSSVHRYSLKKMCVLAEMLASVFAGISLWTCGYI